MKFPKPKKTKRLKIKTVRDEVSKFIRIRDKGRCFTCGKQKHWKEMQAGHYIPVSVCNALRFDSINVHCQCYRCNINLSGNVHEYRPRLIEFYGLELVERLEARRHETKTWSQQELKDILEETKATLKTYVNLWGEIVV